MDLVSIVITTHNRLKYLKNAIDSVLKQTYKNIELIVVDDASNDGTYEYLNNSSNLKYIRIDKEQSKGGNYARNHGILASKGKYIALLDDDDEFMPNKIEEQVNFLINNPSYDVVYCNRIINVNDGKLLYVDKSTKYSGDCSKVIFYNIIGTTSMFMFRRNIIVNNLFDENTKYWQEYDLMMNLCQKTKIGYIDKELITYRKILNDKKTLTNNFDGWLNNINYLNNKYKSYIQVLNDEEKKKRNELIYRDAVTRLSTLKLKKEKRKYLKKIYLNNKSLKNFLKYIFNIDNISILRIKLLFK